MEALISYFQYVSGLLSNYTGSYADMLRYFHRYPLRVYSNNPL